ncbi:hypothetical protein CMV_030195 [Castanea mollissima]|uniref:Uncharacterized protein n=1 Tax=Castanea mollissima TaxID=60419 RepID=A0A8J4Q5N4_9ROSI|nr:hypothetical protein CMV_030195 [Castanea mollissima]
MEYLYYRCSGGEGGSDLGRTRPEQTEIDALIYLKEVKETLQDQREKYDMFLKIMKDFRAQRSDVSGAIAKVKELFEGHNKLISGFDILLPKGSELALEHDGIAPQTKKIDFEEAINVVTKIKVKLLFCAVEFQLQMLVPSGLIMTFVPTEMLSKC